MTTRKNALKADEPEVTIEKNMMVLKFAYDMEFVLPVTDATNILKALESAYKYNAPYNKEATIEPIETNVDSRIISADKYRELRRNHILGVNDATNE
jgi:hypothetical protein|tara:strand:+ start:5016 stop:5306 length:291 start_codon:yes stop_codon:yes gene_type:complete